MRKKKILVVNMILLLAILMCACENLQLVGQWVSEDSDVIILRKDKTGSVNGWNVSWYTEEKTIVFVTAFGNHEYQYSVSGNRLTLQGYRYDDVTVYTKQSSVDSSTVLTIIIIIALGCIGIYFLPGTKKNKQKVSISEEKVSITDEDPIDAKSDAVQSGFIPQQEMKSTPDTKSPQYGKHLQYIGEVDDTARNKAGGRTNCAPSIKHIEICPNCGSALPTDAVFCHICGSRVPELSSPEESICLVCGTELPNEALFCPNCGNNVKTSTVSPQAATAKICPACGSKVRDSENICGYCGHDFREEI